MVAALLLVALAASPDSAAVDYGIDGLLQGWAASEMDGGEMTLSDQGYRIRLRMEASFGRGASAIAEPSLSPGGADAGDDSVSIGLDRLLLQARLPGTPWLGGEVFHGCRQPYLPSLSDPYLDVVDTPADSLSGMSLTAGGFLGFRAAYSVYRPYDGDTLSYVRVRAPWAGFGTFRAYRLTRRGPDGTSQLEALEGWLAIRRFSPHVSLLRNRDVDHSWAASFQLRGVRLRPSLDLRLDVVPELHLAGRALEPGTGGLQPRQRSAALRMSMFSVQRSISAWGYGMVDFEGMVDDSVGAGLHMLSRAGIDYSLQAGMPLDGELLARLDADLRGERSGAGAGLVLRGDSLRVAGRASYSPRRDVHGILEISGAPAGELDPVGQVAVRVATARMAGGLSMHWRSGDVTLGVDLVTEVGP